MRALHEHRGQEIIYHLEIRATGTKGERALCNIPGSERQGGSGMGNLPRATTRRTDYSPDLYRETLGCCLDSHDEDIPVCVGGGRHARCDQPMARNHIPSHVCKGACRTTPTRSSSEGFLQSSSDVTLFTP